MTTLKESCTEGVTTQDGFRIRMEAQCGQIERYRVLVKDTQGRCLSLNEAAMEWIERYAPAFDSCGQVPEQ